MSEPTPRPGYDICECCQRDDVPLTAYRWNLYDPRVHTEDSEFNFFCRVCASTFLSRAFTNPGVGDQPLYSSIGWIANEILKRLPTPDSEARATKGEGE